MSKLLELREKRDKLAEEIKRFAEKANDEKQEWSAEDQANYERCNADFDANDAELKAEAEAEKSRRTVIDRHKEIERTISEDREFRRRIGRDDFRRRPNDRGGEITEEERSLALQGWFRKSTPFRQTERHLDAIDRCGFDLDHPYLEIPLTRINIPRTVAEARALSGISGPAGAYTIPSGMLQAFEVALLAWGGMRQAAEVIRTDGGETLPYPTSDDTSNTGEMLGENNEASEQDITFGLQQIFAHTYSSKIVKVPNQLLQDSAINLAQFIGDRCGERIGRKQNTHFTTGDGAAKPNGLINAATLGVTFASASALTVDEVWDLKASVDPAYRNGAGWMVKDSIVWAIRKLKAGDGHYLWQPALVAGNPNTFDGDPLYINQDMATIAASAKVMAYGQFSRYKIRDAGTMVLRRLDERYAEYNQTAFVAFLRSDGNLIDAGTHPVKYAAMHS